MVRLYIQIASSTDPDFNPRKTATVEEVQAAAKRIFQPYYCDWDRVEWYSVYPIGQGIAEKYTLDHRVFMGGDVCHTHSPKAGQGMNTAFHDALNLAWKLHHVESGFADRSILSTYEPERKSVAETLLDFDNKYAALFSQRQPSSSEVHTASNSSTSGDTNTTAPEDENPFVAMFKANCEFTAGYGVAYGPNIYNHSADHAYQHSLIHVNHPKLRTGRIMPNSNVTRVADANLVHLENEIPCNGSFRLFVFAGANISPKKGQHKALSDFAEALQSPNSFYSRSGWADGERDTHHDHDNPHTPLFSVALVLAARRSEIEISDLPPLFQDYAGRIYADDVWQKAAADAKAPAHMKTGFGDSEEGGVVVVRPDGHVACSVTMKGKETAEALEGYFSTFLNKDAKKSTTREPRFGLGGGAGRMRAQL
jgi:hypothetical protein